MLKIGKGTKDIKLGSKQVLKVYRGVDIVWEKEMGTLVYSDTGKQEYTITIYSWSKLNPNKNYKFVTNRPDNKYSIIVSGSYYTIKNNDIFRIAGSCDIEIRNINHNYYDIKIYEVDEKATIVI